MVSTLWILNAGGPLQLYFLFSNARKPLKEASLYGEASKRFLTSNLRLRYEPMVRTSIMRSKNIQCLPYTEWKMKFCIKEFFGKCNQIRRKLRIWSHLLKKPLMENVIFCEVLSVGISSTETYVTVKIKFSM